MVNHGWLRDVKNMLVETNNPIKRAIFLDFDGVILNDGKIHLESIKNLNRIINAYPDISIEISSGRRFDPESAINLIRDYVYPVPIFCIKKTCYSNFHALTDFG